MSLFVHGSFKWYQDPQLDFDSICTLEGARAAADDLADYVVNYGHPYGTAVELPYEFAFLDDFADAFVQSLMAKGDSAENYKIGMWEKDVPAFKNAAAKKAFLAA